MPAEIYRLDLGRFDKLTLALALNTTLAGVEPLQHKGGIMHELFKEAGQAKFSKSWRGTSLGDVLGKKVRRIQRRWLNKYS